MRSLKFMFYGLQLVTSYLFKIFKSHYRASLLTLHGLLNNVWFKIPYQLPDGTLKLTPIDFAANLLYCFEKKLQPGKKTGNIISVSWVVQQKKQL